MQTLVKKSVSASVAASVLAMSMYVSFEPTVSGAATQSDTVQVALSVASQITLSAATDTTFSRALDLTANTATAQVYWNVISNDNDGYTLQIRNASSSPALRNTTDASEGHFADYTPASANVPEAWSVPSGSKEFGISAFGSHTTGYGTDTDCVAAAHTPSATLLYRDLPTTNITIASTTSTTSLSGVVTNVCFAVEQDNVYAADGTYIVEVTATATTN